MNAWTNVFAASGDKDCSVGLVCRIVSTWLVDDDSVVYIYYYAEAANSGQNHTVKHNTAHSSQIKKGTYIHSN